MSPKTFLLLNTNETARDPRVRRVGSTLAPGGRVIALQTCFEEAEDRAGPIQILRVDPPETGLADVADLAGDLLRRCHPAVLEDEPGKKLVHRLGRSFRYRLHRALPDRVAPDPDEELLHLRGQLLANLSLYRAALEVSPDLVYCNDLDTLLAGFLLKERLSIPLVYDAHEIYSEQFPHAGETRRSFYRNLERELAPRADLRLTVCDSLANWLKESVGSDFHVIRNCPNLAQVMPESVLLRKNDPRVLLYHGAMTRERGLDSLVRATPKIRGARLVLRGFGPHEQALRKLVKQLRLEDRVSFPGPVTVDELIPRASECDVGVIPIPPTNLNQEYCLPNKFFEYMAAGLALASTNLLELRRVTEEHQLGCLFPPEQMAEALGAFLRQGEGLEHCRVNALRAARERYHWEAEESRLRTLIEQCVASPG